MAEHGPYAHRKQVGFGTADDEGGSAHRRGDLAVSEQPRPRWLPAAAVTAGHAFRGFANTPWGGGGVVPQLCGPEVPAQRVWVLSPGLRVHLAQGDVNSAPVAVGLTTRFLTG